MIRLRTEKVVKKERRGKRAREENIRATVRSFLALLASVRLEGV
jgi:hypothetical protein